MRWTVDGPRMWFEALLPTEQGAKVARALDRLIKRLEATTGSDGRRSLDTDARRADALVQMASAQISSDPDPDRATVVVHAPLDALLSCEGSCEIEGIGTVHPEIAGLLACDARIETVLEDAGGRALGIGWATRNPSHGLMRQLRWRDDGCTFPGCGHKRYVHAHHIVPWPQGPTELDNLVLVCSFHHDLVHKHGWRVALGRRPGVTYWFRPDNEPYELGRSPPRLVRA